MNPLLFRIMIMELRAFSVIGYCFTKNCKASTVIDGLMMQQDGHRRLMGTLCTHVVSLRYRNRSNKICIRLLMLYIPMYHIDANRVIVINKVNSGIYRIYTGPEFISFATVT